MKTIIPTFLIFMVLALGGEPSQGQQLSGIPRIGVLAGGQPSSRRHQDFRQAFLGGLRELGYFEGKNIAIEYRYAEGKRDRLPHLAAELVQLKVALIVTSGPNITRYAMKATRTIPIVMVGSGNAVGRGLVKSLAQPGGNVTGLSSFVEGEDVKRMELFKEAFPSISRVAVLNARRRKNSVRNYQSAGKALGLDVQVVNFRKAEELDIALSRIAAMHPDALIAVPSGLTNRNMEKIAQFALKNRLPSLLPRKRFVTVGGLMSYDVKRLLMVRRAAVYVDKILKGANPATLPVEPPQLELVINLKTAKKIGVTIPPEILLEASEIIK